MRAMDGRELSSPNYEYIVLVSNDNLPIIALAQLYRDRADCENVFDEIKNQWGWAGFVTQDLQRCGVIGRLIALIYNWWNIFRSIMIKVHPKPLHNWQLTLCTLATQNPVYL